GGGAMTAVLVSGPSSGALVFNANGSFGYTPNAGFTGADSFTYRAQNGAGPGNVATVTITVGGGSPTTAADAYSTPYLTTLTLTAPGVLGNDNSNGGGAMTAELLSSTSNGTLSLSANGGVSYTPNFGFAGTDSFTYRAVNVAGPGNAATVTITVNAPTTVQAPYNLRVDSVAGNTVTLRWDALPIGPQASTFILEGGLNPGEVLASIPSGHAAPIFTVVAPTGSFYVRMHGQLGSDKSPASNEVRLHVNVPVAPSAPANLLGTVNGSTVDLEWKNTFGGGAPTGLVLDVTGSLATSLPLTPGERFTFTPVPGGSYTFRLRATNAGGASAPSDPVGLSFPAACTGVPAAPANVLAYRLGSTGYVVWDPPASGPAPTGYVLHVTGAFSGSFATPGRVLSGAVAAGTYNLSLVATNACGTGAPANTVLVVP
ncbi:MAG: cadherin-like domain-containing protein, partial [Acidobacteria bacterium]|nr:cadherin-like domain-containing protein [Acidobacteriota bacterium]